MIIGITGTDGAGKGAVVDYLLKEKGFIHYSSREEILKEIKQRSLPEDRGTMREVANDMRRLYGDDVMVARPMKDILEKKVDKAVIESIRTLDEVDTLKVNGGVLLAVDADQKLRYKRIQARQSSSDQVSFEEFVSHEELEANDPDPHGMQKKKVMELADHTILNEGTLEKLHQNIDLFLKKFKNKTQ